MSYGACWLIHALKPASLPMVIVYEWWLDRGCHHACSALCSAPSIPD